MKLFKTYFSGALLCSLPCAPPRAVAPYLPGRYPLPAAPGMKRTGGADAPDRFHCRPQGGFPWRPQFSRDSTGIGHGAFRSPISRRKRFMAGVFGEFTANRNGTKMAPGRQRGVAARVSGDPHGFFDGCRFTIRSLLAVQAHLNGEDSLPEQFFLLRIGEG